jgi:RHS repeat-associated protein
MSWLRRFRVLLLVILHSAICSSLFRAQSGPDNDPAAAQGYVDNAFHDSSFDSINEFNGQLTVPIQLGPDYPVGPSLKLQLMLVYNSRVWEYGAPVPEDTNGAWRPIVGDPALGIGWNLTPGKVVPCGSGLQRVCFSRSDGAEIVFFSETPGATVWQTQDGNRYRLSRAGASGPYTMSDGDGLTYTFDHQVSGYDDVRTSAPGYTRDFGRGRDGWYLTEIRDLYGNRIEVEYWPAASSCTTGCMDCSGTNSWIPRYFRVQPVGEAEDLVAEVLLDAGQTQPVSGVRFKVRQGPSEAWVDWNFIYTDVTVSRAGFSGCEAPVVKALSRVELPSDIAGLAGGQRARYEFIYWQGQGLAFDGLLKTMKLPTGVDVAYAYGNYHFYSARRASFPTSECNPQKPPTSNQFVRRSSVITVDGGGFAPPPEGGTSGPCLPGVDVRLWSQTQSGVVRRTVSGLGVPTGQTAYTQYSAPNGELGGTDTDIQQTMTAVLPPPDADGRRRGRVTLFYASEASPDDESLPGGRMGTELWTANYEGDPNHGGVDTNSVPLSPVCTSSPPSTLCVKNAIRVVQQSQQLIPFRHSSGQTTYYEPVTSDDPYALSYCGSCKQHSVAFSPEPTWASNGRHYSLETHSGNLGGDARTIETIWDPRPDPWLRNLFTRKIESLPGPPSGAPAGTRTVVDRSYAFGSNGFLSAVWTWDQPSRRILAECRYSDLAGNVQHRVTATDVTGNYQQTPATSPCPGSLGAWGTAIGTNNDAFGESHTFSRGLQTQRYSLRGQSSIGWFAERVERHPATGWVTTSYDTAGVSTGMINDSIGRVVSISPSGEAPTAVAYDSPVKTTASRSGSGNTWQRYLYDSLGRLSREIRQMPGAYAVRVREYDAAGNSTFESEWGSCGFPDGDCVTVRPAGTSFSDFDPFGRPRLIRRADGSRTTFSFADGSATHSDSVKTVNVENVGGACSAGSCSGGATATMVHRSDAFGRVTSVTEPAAPASDVTDYVYDVAGKLVKVSQGPQQSRTFLYDSFGFPLTETTPEAGTVDFQTTYPPTGVAYSDVGSLGNVRSRKEGGGTVVRTFAHDPAGRLKAESGGGTTYVTNCWDGEAVSPCAAAGGTYPGGKLTQRIGANPGKPSTVTETFTYSGLGGRLSRKNVSVTNTPSGTLTAIQDWIWNSLGLPATHTHPRIGADAAVTTSYTYSLGYPTLLQVGTTQIVKSTTYSPSGALTQWRAGNDVITSIDPDSSGIPRPASISTSGSTGGGFSSGPYVYDGAGNIQRIDLNTFVYDARSRLLSAYGKSYAYDRWGNLNPTDRVDPTTNRLVPGLVSYDLRGNLLSTAGQSYSYDALSRQTRSGGERYLYDGGGERIARVTGGERYYTITPCRLLDTRPSNSLAHGETRVVPVTGGSCGVAAGATSVTGNLTVVAPGHGGFLRLSPSGTAPATSTLNFSAGQIRANNFTLGLSAEGALDLLAFSGTGTGLTDAIIDLSGYFMTNPSSESWALTFREEGNRISSEYLGAVRQKDYFYLGNLLVATRTGTGSGTWLYYASDHLGTPRLVTNASKAKVEEHSYDAFGIEMTGGFGNQPLKFAAMERDGTSKNDYVHARFQSSELGRFLSPDVLGGKPEDPQTWNRYAYARNNPIKFVDPNGMEFGYPGQQQDLNQVLAAQAIARGDELFRGEPLPVRGGPVGPEEALGTAAFLSGAGQFATGLLRLGAQSLARSSIRSGEIIFKEFATSKGPLEIAAEAGVQGKTLLLKDIAVYPRGAEKLALGTKEVLQLAGQLAREAQKLGFEKLVITGVRTTGANPGKLVKITIDIAQFLAR